MNNDMIPVCNLPLAYPEDMSYLWNTLTMVSCVMTLLVYFLTYLMLYKFAPKTADSAALAQIKIQKVLVNTLALNVASYAVSSLLSAAIIFAIKQMRFDASVVADAETYAVIPEEAEFIVYGGVEGEDAEDEARLIDDNQNIGCQPESVFYY
ncbi:hypothetical protein L596_021588 [Steinernema carpocapsae]|uniref:Uncharacterized protein n=1 Tax=Steinernema carpocapsae TaxID=34508 RepID=A0A4U5MJ88_STECR|nr:hypothetical protein L596_021588 [Steinernema carpocapsae]